MHKIITFTAVTTAAAVVILGVVAARTAFRGEQARVDREFHAIMFEANRHGRRWAD